MRRLALIALFAAACGPSAATASGQSLSLSFHKGDVYRYSFQLAVNAVYNGVPDTLNETAKLIYTVMSVDAAGTADLSLETSDVAITSSVDQMTTPMSGLPTTTIDLTVAADGRVLSEDPNGNPAGGGITWGVLPVGVAKPGDTWVKEYDMTSAGAVGTNHFATTSRYLRNESFQGANAAVVETAVTNSSDLVSRAATPGGSTASGKATSKAVLTTWIDRDAHRILKSHMTATFDESGTFDAPSQPPPTVFSIKGDQTGDMLPA